MIEIIEEVFILKSYDLRSIARPIRLKNRLSFRNLKGKAHTVILRNKRDFSFPYKTLFLILLRVPAIIINAP